MHKPLNMKPASAAARRNIEVWLVEDNHVYRQTVMDLLNETPGIRCREAFNICESALAKMNDGSRPDVLLLDVQLPKINGIEALPKIKAAAPNTKVVMLTVFEDHEKIFKAICAGASGYLLKTAAADAIVASVHQVMAGGSPMSPRVSTAVLKMFAQMAPPKSESNLTTRERQVLELMTEGLSKKEIAARLELSFHTVDEYLSNIYKKLHVHSQAGAVAKALKQGWFK